MLNSDGRAAAIYQVVQAQSGFGAVNAAERTSILNQLKQFFGADTNYLTQNAQINPGSLANNAGQAVQVTPASGSGATAAPQTIVGLGTLS